MGRIVREIDRYKHDARMLQPEAAYAFQHVPGRGSKFDGHAATIGVDHGLAFTARDVDRLASVVSDVDHDTSFTGYQLQAIRARDVRLAPVRRGRGAVAGGGLGMCPLRETRAQEQYGNDSHAGVTAR